ncbi:hypothetical protein AB0G32_18715 [Streptomyces sp. NPDC023723]|uniref:hypothetical protein n=1 Tax=Streptomyces sp. NPDC023723 TaxID=3154323 RepID=UPI0033FA4978
MPRTRPRRARRGPAAAARTAVGKPSTAPHYALCAVPGRVRRLVAGRLAGFPPRGTEGAVPPPGAVPRGAARRVRPG